MTNEVSRLQIGDVVISARGTPYTVVGWTPKGKLRMKASSHKTETTGWWPYASSMPRGYQVWRGEVRLR